jgi:Phage tail assembly chaperone proteins, E, or 41 or 14
MEKNEESRVKTNDDGSVTVTLKFPISVEGERANSLTVRRLKGKQLKKIDLRGLTKGDAMLGVISQLTGVAPPYLDELDADDFAEISEVITSFFGKSRATGERS